MAARRLKQAKRSIYIGAKVSVWLLNGRNNVSTRRKVENASDTCHRRSYRGRIGDVAIDNLETRVGRMLLEVSPTADYEGVEDSHGTAERNQPID